MDAHGRDFDCGAPPGPDLPLQGVLASLRDRTLEVYLAFRELDNVELATRPCSVVAHELDVSLPTVTRHVKKLVEAGLLRQVSRYAYIIPLEAEDGVVSMASVSRAREIADKLKAKQVKEKKTRKRKVRIASHEKAVFMQLYADYRRKTGSAYRQAGGDNKYALEVISNLKSRAVGVDYYKDYIEFCGKRWDSHRPKGAPPYAPWNYIKSLKVIDAFLERQGDRVVDVKAVAKHLKWAGIKGVNPAMVATMAQNYYGSPEGAANLSEPYRTAVQSVLANIESIGMERAK